MNLTQSFGKAVVLALGGWHAITADTEVGTVIAFVSGLGNVADPWRDLVDWYQRLMMTSAKYDVFATAMRPFTTGEDPLRD
jgi:ABC-type bacteriocin/lantibiotic exporter with double-glycine peptidase domain